MSKVLGIGASLYDVIMSVENYPKENTKQRTDKVTYQCGGPVSTALVAISKLGGEASYFGVFTDDGYSDSMLEEFKRYGIDTSLCIKKGGYSSPFSFIIVSEEAHTRTVLWTGGTLPLLLPEKVPEEAIKASSVIHLDGNQRDAALYAAKIANENGVKVSLDAGSCYPGITEIVEYTDFLVASEEFVREFTGNNDLQDAAKGLYKRFKPEIVVVTQGDSGGFYFDGQKLEQYPAYSVNVVDTTGAGDVFHGAFIFGYLKGWRWERIVRFSSAVSALKCTKSGGRTGIPTYCEAVNFMKEYGEVEFFE